MKQTTDTWDTTQNRNAIGGDNNSPASVPDPSSTLDNQTQPASGMPMQNVDDLDENGLAPTGEAAAPKLAGDMTDQQWLDYVRRSYNASTNFKNTSIVAQWERNYRLFHSRHPQGSKYNSDDYKAKSRIFRPKTRAMVRKNEAAAAAAFFSTQDVVRVAAENEGDSTQHASASIWQEIMNYRLSKTIKWFMICMGAFQDAQVAGICCSRQYWDYRENVRRELQPVLHPDTMPHPVTGEQVAHPFAGQAMKDPTTGQMMAHEIVTREIISDKPVCELVPPENICFDPAADWIDPINSSPYLQIVIPMTVGDVKDRCGDSPDKKTKSMPWKMPDSSDFANGKTLDQQNTNPVRQAREGDRRLDPQQTNRVEIHDYDIVYVIENFFRVKGQDYTFYTLGYSYLLSEPVPIEKAYLHGVRPVAFGVGILEAHRNFPASKVEITQDLQLLANDIANQRIDNVKIAMNGRYFVRRGRNVDLEAIRRSVAGSTVELTDIDKDVKWERPADVTASSYREQDLVNVDFDEIGGAFSPASVQSNRQLNETVGGMDLLSDSANQIGEYDLRVFAETWVQNACRQLLLLEQAYETDPVLLAMAAKQAKLVQRFGTDQVTDELLQQELSVTVSVGIGATDPMKRLQRFMTAGEAIGKLCGQAMVGKINVEEVASEIMGLAGYRDGKRFFLFPDDGATPETHQLYDQIQQLTQHMQGLQKAVDDKSADRASEEKIAAMKNDTTLQTTIMNNQALIESKLAGVQTALAEFDNQYRMAMLETSANLTTQILNSRQELMMAIHGAITNGTTPAGGGQGQPPGPPSPPPSQIAAPPVPPPGPPPGPPGPPMMLPPPGPALNGGTPQMPQHQGA